MNWLLPIILSSVGIMLSRAAAEPAVFVTSDERTGRHMSRMWDVYGQIVDDAVVRFGNEPAWYEWMALKLMWSDLEQDKQTLRQKVVDWPINRHGYVWTWATEEGWPTHHGRHYENNGKYIMSVCRQFAWTNDRSFLAEVDRTTTQSQFPDHTDVSQGMTVLEKTRLAMRFQLHHMHGRDGLLRIDDPQVDGTVDGLPGDYWDNFRFGYLSAYTNIYFYGSLLLMADLEEALGNARTGERLRAIAAKTRQRFNETFWDDEKGRYIGCIDRTGRVWDFGFTYLNLEAIFYGLVPDDRARQIFAWLDGERIIASDLQEVRGRTVGSVGEDIYALRWAPRSITRAVESIQVDGKYWWWDINGAITVGGGRPTAAYGEHLENGGAIFYVSFYDVMARLKVLGPEAAWQRLSAIIDEFGIDELRRDPVNPVGAPWVWGIIGEFPESGLVPTTFVHGLMGVDARHDGLHIRPELPEALEWAEIRTLAYRGNLWRIRAERSEPGHVARIELNATNAPRHGLTLHNLRPKTLYTIRLDNQSQRRVSDDAGRLHLPRVGARRIIVEQQDR
jgi:hypothetical protein